MPELKEAPAPAKTKENAAPRHTEPAPKAPMPAASPAVGAAPWAANPFSFMRRFAREMDRVFEDFGLERGLHAPAVLGRTRDLLRRESESFNADWTPQIDVQEKDGNLVVHADLPGLAKDDVKIEVKDDVLTIHGQTKRQKEEKREGYYCQERSCGTFYRAIPLPEGAEAGKAVANFRNGVLEITIPAPKLAQSRAHKIEIKD